MPKAIFLMRPAVLGAGAVSDVGIADAGEGAVATAGVAGVC
jgi:hypothetical protein